LMNNEFIFLPIAFNSLVFPMLFLIAVKASGENLKRYDIVYPFIGLVSGFLMIGLYYVFIMTALSLAAAISPDNMTIRFASGEASFILLQTLWFLFFGWVSAKFVKIKICKYFVPALL